MKKLLVVSIILFVAFVLFCTNTIQELPDVEISGPALLRSTLEKRSLSPEDLFISDIVDSLNPIFPRMIRDEIRYFKKKSSSLYADLNSVLGANLYLISDSIFTSPNSVYLNLRRSSLKNEWSAIYGKVGIIFSMNDSQLVVYYKSTNAFSPISIEYQSDNAIHINYYLNKYNLFNKKLDIMLDFAVHSKRVEYDFSNSDDKSNYFSGHTKFISDITSSIGMDITAHYVHETPLIELNVDISRLTEDKSLDMIKCIGINITENHVVPSMHLAQRYIIDNSSYLFLYQKSSVDIKDNFSLLKEQPWQYDISDAFITFNPINFQVVYTYKNPVTHPINTILSAESGIKYSIDEPAYQTLDGGLPFIYSADVLKTYLGASGDITYSDFSVKQSFELNKGWYTSNSQNIHYLPLFTSKSSIKYRRDNYNISGWLNQYFGTKSDENKYLRDALVLGLGTEYNLRTNVTLYLKADNLLNKGRIIYRTVPEEPLSVKAGILYSF